MGRVVHFEIHATDPDRAERFYTDVFGWNVTRWGGADDYRLVTTGRTTSRVSTARSRCAAARTAARTAGRTAARTAARSAGRR